MIKDGKTTMDDIYYMSYKTNQINNITEQNSISLTNNKLYMLYIKAMIIPGIAFITNYLLQIKIINGWNGYHESKFKAFRIFLLYSKAVEKKIKQEML